MEMNDRIRLIRTNAGLTQEKFAERLGLKRNSVANYEIGRNTPLDAITCSICKEFNVNENWLRYGQGEMYCFSDDDDEFQAAMKEINSHDPIVRQIILNYWHMNETEKDQFWNFLKHLAPNVKGENE